MCWSWISIALAHTLIILIHLNSTEKLHRLHSYFFYTSILVPKDIIRLQTEGVEKRKGSDPSPKADQKLCLWRFPVQGLLQFHLYPFPYRDIWGSYLFLLMNNDRNIPLPTPPMFSSLYAGIIINAIQSIS